VDNLEQALYAAKICAYAQVSRYCGTPRRLTIGTSTMVTSRRHGEQAASFELDFWIASTRRLRPSRICTTYCWCLTSSRLSVKLWELAARRGRRCIARSARAAMSSALPITIAIVQRVCRQICCKRSETIRRAHYERIDAPRGAFFHTEWQEIEESRGDGITA